MDVEEISRRHLAAGAPDDEIVRILARDVLSIKHRRVTPAYAEAFARAVLTEAKNSTGLAGDLFAFESSGSTMGEFGVGSRGSGDFFAHRQLARIIGRTDAAVGVDEMDDAGAVRAQGDYIITTVDGMHSRLSDFPFLAGFHVTRATLRDVYVMGAKPVALLSDIHVADDGDVAKIFDYTAGVSAVGEAMGVPLVTGSTLRIGGDMVLGSRMTGCVGAVGVASHLTARKQIAPGDVLLMTEGAGGGTIATAAIYSGFPDVVEETINLHFLKACEALLASDVLPAIHAMTDVTNGGLRGDAYEMAETAGCRIVVVEDELRVAPPEVAPEIRRVVESAGVAMKEVGYVEEGKPESVLSVKGEIRDFTPRFRESAYTPVKKVVDEDKRDFEEMKIGVARAAEAALAKKLRILSRLRSS
ncbi:MAG: AIR synthase related protein [Methanoculleus marisnigri]|uniref:AIR synthase related protein n=1 Tax=Methanoculleus marisnigri TaxID=2198 RepID=A0A101IQI1_9EURY|nr:MAG: AIR synthase related protein [Methanoculleus marisnigri]